MQQYQARVTALLSKAEDELRRRLRTAGDLDDIEAAARGTADRLAADLVEALVEEADHVLQQWRPRGWRVIGQRIRTVVSTVGTLRLRRTLYRDHKGRARFLLDEEMARKVVIRLSQALGREPAEPYQGPPLSPQERRILDMVIHGRGNKEIAAALTVSEGTVKTHLRQLYRKLQVHSRAEAAAKGTHFRL